MIRFCTLISVALAVACNGTPDARNSVVTSAIAPRASAVGEAPTSAKPLDSAAPSAPAASAVPTRDSVAAKSHMPSTLKVKRLIVTTGVKDREPLESAAALPSDGSAIYAFAELSNPDGLSENVRITFERKGGAERVGNVMLPVPGKVSRHRTWATTRFIRVGGVWEAVLWGADGSELGRTSFEVASS